MDQAIMGEDDGLMTVAPMLERVGNWPANPRAGLGEAEREALSRHERTGRPLDSAAFVVGLEKRLKRPLQKRKPGPKKPAETRKKKAAKPRSRH